MSDLSGRHLVAVAFFVALLAFERLRRSPALGIVRHPMYAYLARIALAAIYFAIAGLDPRAWLNGPAQEWLIAVALVVIAIAVLRRRDAMALARNPPMALQAAYLAGVVAFVEELVFRGAFVMAAAVTPETTLLASAGSAAAYVVWRYVTYRDRDPASLAIVFLSSLGLGLLAGFARSLWPGVLAHGAYVLLAGPPRAPRRRPDTSIPSAARP